MIQIKFIKEGDDLKQILFLASEFFLILKGIFDRPAEEVGIATEVCIEDGGAVAGPPFNQFETVYANKWSP